MIVLLLRHKLSTIYIYNIGFVTGLVHFDFIIVAAEIVDYIYIIGLVYFDEAGFPEKIVNYKL